LPWEAATARVKAIETPRIALAPSVALFGVPSRSMRVRSSSSTVSKGLPTTAFAIGPVTLPTALSTPMPE
jgi:hypothetical protein